MNFLQLCQRTAIECGVASTQVVALALPTVVGATGSLGRIVNWVGDSWSDIQTLHADWTWLRSSNILGHGASFQTVGGQYNYPLGVGPGTVGVTEDAFGQWDRQTWRSFTTAQGIQDETVIADIPYDSWRDGYMIGAQRTVQTRPYVAAVGPDQSICLGPPPNSSYTITADYFMAPSEMTTDTDVPLGLPLRYHMLICYGAMLSYSGYESAPEVFQSGQRQYSLMKAQLERQRAPNVYFSGALA